MRASWRLRDSCQTRCCRIALSRLDNTRSMQLRNERTDPGTLRETSRMARASSSTSNKLTWKTFLKKGLLADSITLCAVRHCPSLARVTSTRPSSSHRLSKLVAILLRKLFHFRHIWLDISRLMSDGTLGGVSRTLSQRGVRGTLSRDDGDGERDSGTAVVPGTHKHRENTTEQHGRPRYWSPFARQIRMMWRFKPVFRHRTVTFCTYNTRGWWDMIFYMVPHLFTHNFENVAIIHSMK